MALLEVEALRVAYGAIEVLHEVSLTVDHGEIVTLIGANGAGKTTTLLAISGVLKPASGSVRFDGKDITRLPAHQLVQLGLAHSPEGRKIFSRLTVQENLELGAFTRRDAQAVRQDIARAFERFPVLGERRAQAGGTLSGGEQQMLAVARAMMSRPKLLLLDEPSLGLAPLIVQRIFDVIKELNREGVTVLLVEQNAVMALKLASRGYVLETGSVAMTDRADVLLADERVRRAYLGD
jgi:branched-chain amino acid transport system ATP-binding protein